jgi:hypothetical protein
MAPTSEVQTICNREKEQFSILQLDVEINFHIHGCYKGWHKSEPIGSKVSKVEKKEYKKVTSTPIQAPLNIHTSPGTSPTSSFQVLGVLKILRYLISKRYSILRQWYPSMWSWAKPTLRRPPLERIESCQACPKIQTIGGMCWSSYLLCVLRSPQRFLHFGFTLAYE